MPSTQALVLRDIVQSLEATTIRKLVIVNGHGGNDFRQMIRELQPKVKLFLCAVSWYKVVDPKGHFTDLGDHAGELETSVMLHIAPDLVELSAAGDGHEKKPKIQAMREGWAWAPRRWTQVTADTGIGDPRAATETKGERYVNETAVRLGQFLVDLARIDPAELYE
jgi:creatinine amidohydrolase